MKGMQLFSSSYLQPLHLWLAFFGMLDTGDEGNDSSCHWALG
jgi:hypothetical protein